MPTKSKRQPPTKLTRTAAEIFDSLPRDAENEQQRVIVEATGNLHAAMQYANVETPELAKRLKVSRAEIRKLLAGEGELTLERLANAAHALGMSLHVYFRTPAADSPRMVDADHHEEAFLEARARNKRARAR